jgi:hypothetical protein
MEGAERHDRTVRVLDRHFERHRRLPLQLSELAYGFSERFSAGIVGQRTNVFDQELTIDRGLLFNVATGKGSHLTAYIFNPDLDDPYVSIAFGSGSRPRARISAAFSAHPSVVRARRDSGSFAARVPTQHERRQTERDRRRGEQRLRARLPEVDRAPTPAASSEPAILIQRQPSTTSAVKPASHTVGIHTAAALPCRRTRS